MRSKEFANTNNVVAPTQFIEFGGGTTFNGIRTTFPRIPYLLQDPQEKYYSDNGPRCNDGNRPPLPTPPKNYVACNHVIKFPYVEDGWYEIVLINNNQGGAAHPIHQHGGWFWIVGEGQFPFDQTINKTFIEQKFKIGELQKNTTFTTYYNGTNSLPKDVIQVPNNGYVIIRARTNNPGTWIFHCHIDFHLAIGMGLVIQVGEPKDWNVGPLELNKNCKQKPHCPTGGDANVAWFLFMSEKGVERCIVDGKNATFSWITGASQVHNVNYLNDLLQDSPDPHKVIPEIYKECNFNVAGSGIIDEDPETPNQVRIVVKGLGGLNDQYFVCGIGDGFHCNHGVKAKFRVVDDPSQCHIHPYTYDNCDD